MNHLIEAEKELDNSGGFYPGHDDNERATFALLLAQTHALIAIAYALETLADCVTANGVLHVATHKEE